jgi:hypothetical protein
MTTSVLAVLRRPTLFLVEGQNCPGAGGSRGRRSVQFEAGEHLVGSMPIWTTERNEPLKTQESAGPGVDRADFVEQVFAAGGSISSHSS